MSRTVKEADIRRQELIDIALKQFIQSGYEKTSVRSILKEADGEIGMFYHYFKSKKEIYEAALKNYNDGFIQHITQIVYAKELNMTETLYQVLGCIPGSIEEYSQMFTQVEPDVMTIMLSRTLHRMVPIIEQIITDGQEKNEITVPIENTHALSRFVLFGVSGVLHDNEIKTMDEKMLHIKLLLQQLLGINIQ